MGGWSLAEDCVFVDNWATNRHGGGIFMWQCGATVTECTIVGNRAAEGGGIYCFTGWGEIRHSVIAFNSNGGAIACENAGDEYLQRENIIFGNDDGNSVCGIPSDNLFVDPLFCDLYGGSSGERDLGLCSKSPCLPENNDFSVHIGATWATCEDCNSPVRNFTWGRLKALYSSR